MNPGRRNPDLRYCQRSKTLPAIVYHTLCSQTISIKTAKGSRRFYYSVLKLFTGLVIAALMAW